MPVIKSESIRQLKERVDIVEVVSREVSLKRSGSYQKGLSPFNDEKTPSFFVSPDKGLYKCFSSGKAGDVISFVMEIERLSFVEAVEALAQRYGVKLEYEQGGVPQQERSLRQELFELHEMAADFYHERFIAEDEAGAWIRAYWTEQRGFGIDVAQSWKIGYAPADSAELGRRALKRGFSKEALEQSGLFYLRRGGAPGRMGYRFRGRLTIPIRDHQGRIVAFTARQLERTPEDDPSREAKYVNSPETPIFRKGGLLFNLDRARMEVDERTPFVLVEGQLDAIRCSSAGVKGAVAPQGTGVTEPQMRLIKRYAPRLRCLLDGDRAGRQAALRLLPLALAQGVEVSFLPLDEGEDPDDLVRARGAAALEDLLQRERDAVAFACGALAEDPAALSPQAKANAARELFAIFAQAESAAAQRAYVAQAAGFLGIEPNAAQQDYTRYLQNRSRPASRRASADSEARQGEQSRSGSVYSAERDLLALCLHVEGLGREVAPLIDESWIDASRTDGQLLNHVLNEFLHDMWSGPESLDESLESEELKRLAANLLFEEPVCEDPRRLANEAIRRIAIKHADRELAKIKLEIEKKQENFDDELLLLLEKTSHLQKIRSVPPKLGAPRPS